MRRVKASQRVDFYKTTRFCYSYPEEDNKGEVHLVIFPRTSASGELLPRENSQEDEIPLQQDINVSQE